jgi:hypothetical protein
MRGAVRQRPRTALMGYVRTSIVIAEAPNLGILCCALSVAAIVVVNSTP